MLGRRNDSDDSDLSQAFVLRNDDQPSISYGTAESELLIEATVLRKAEGGISYKFRPELAANNEVTGNPRKRGPSSERISEP